ncbi:MFS transporter [Spirosoma areae]
MAVPTVSSTRQSQNPGLFSLPVIVAALGYFVDIYDLLLFGIVRVPSLKDLGLTPDQISTVGANILNWQMGGLLLGGIVWGVLGDKKGRLSVLFGSIITYSIANVACGFVKNVTFMDPTVYYALMRFIAGIGLAGELGAGITLVSEVLPKEKRAIGTSLVAGIGLFGAVVAYFTVKLFDWQMAFFMGGGLGFGLLLLRVGVVESGMFKNISADKHVNRGDFLSFFTNAERFSRYIKCIGIGLPTWFVIGILATFSNEFGKALGLAEEIQPGLAIMWCYVGLAVGDLASGFISQAMESRKKAVALLMAIALAFGLVYLYFGIKSATALYGLCLAMGVGIGYWAMFVTIGAEQFGTNLRATAATTIPNMVRGTVILMTNLYAYLKPSLNIINAGAAVGLICFVLGFYSILTVPETHGKDLDYLEE